MRVPRNNGKNRLWLVHGAHGPRDVQGCTVPLPLCVLTAVYFKRKNLCCGEQSKKSLELFCGLESVSMHVPRNDGKNKLWLILLQFRSWHAFTQGRFVLGCIIVLLPLCM
jgi:hypothetical protein